MSTPGEVALPVEVAAPPSGEARPAEPARRARTEPASGTSRQLLLSAGLIAAILLVAFVAPLPPWLGQPTPRPADDGLPAPGIGWPGLALGALFALALTLPFRPYVLALRAAADDAHISTRLVLGGTVVLALTALAIYPRFGSDIFEYVVYERLWTVHGENPLLAIPLAHPEDWAFPISWYPHRPNAYGPLWALLTWPISVLSGESVWLHVFGYKALVTAVYGLCSLMVYRSAPEGCRKRALIAFAWSPLVLFEVLGKVHNDVLPALMLVTGIALAGRGRHVGGLLAITVSALFKVSSAAGGPLIVKRLVVGRHWRALIGGLVLSTILAAGSYVPFWAGARQLDPLISQVSQRVWSIGSVLLLLSEWATGSPQQLAVRALLFVCWLIVLALVLQRMPVDSTAELAAATAVLLLATLGTITTAFYAHYLVPVIALAAISGRPKLESFVLALSVGSLAAYAVGVAALAFGSAWIATPGFEVSGTVLTAAPPVILLCTWLVKHRRATETLVGSTRQ